MTPGASRAAARNDTLKVGDTVATGPNGRAIVVRGQEYLVVAPNSRFRIADPAKSGGMTQIVEQAGHIVYRIKKKATPHFGVQTPYLAAVVKGTTFSVTVDERGATVQVLEGRVEVATRDGGAAYMALPGDIGSVTASARQTLDVKGRETRSIVSPLPPEALPSATEERTEATPALWTDTPAPALEGSITASIGEGPVRLDTLSDGLVRGDSSMNAVIATTATARTSAPVPVVPASVVAPTEIAPPVPATVAPPVVTAPAIVSPAVGAAPPVIAAVVVPPVVTAVVVPPDVSLPVPAVPAVVVPPVVTAPAIVSPAVSPAPPVIAAVVVPPVVTAVVAPPVVPGIGNGGGGGSNGNNGNGVGNGGGNGSNAGGNGNNGNGVGNGGGNGSNAGGNGNNGNGVGNGGGNGSNAGGNGNGDDRGPRRNR